MAKWDVQGWATVRCSMTVEAEDITSAIAKADDTWDNEDSDLSTEAVDESPDWHNAMEIDSDDE